VTDEDAQSLVNFVTYRFYGGKIPPKLLDKAIADWHKHDVTIKT